MVCKPASQARVYEWGEDLERNGAVRALVLRRWSRRSREIDT